jgi:hypothetical protein
MERDYADGIKDDVVFFTGTEVEHTPQFGKKTLFVVGLQSLKDITDTAVIQECKHIYLGANQSFGFNLETIDEWDKLVVDLLKAGYWVTVDLDIKDYVVMCDCLCCWAEHDRFILQISVKLPYITNNNYNTCIKIDDRDFRATNPGVWVHQLHDLMDRRRFTSWDAYTKDEAL